jgi:uncharacterized Zn finger protein
MNTCPKCQSDKNYISNVLYEKDVSGSELDMPSDFVYECESCCHIWLEPAYDLGDEIYISTVDDFDFKREV